MKNLFENVILSIVDFAAARMSQRFAYRVINAINNRTAIVDGIVDNAVEGARRDK